MIITYAAVTEATARTVEMLTIQAYVAPATTAPLWRDQAIGALRLWDEIVDGAAFPGDRSRILALIGQIPENQPPG